LPKNLRQFDIEEKPMKRKSAFLSRRPHLVFLSFAVLLAFVLLAAPLRPVVVEAQREEMQSPSTYFFSEDFDGVTAPALPAGWTTSFAGQIQPFTTMSVMPIPCRTAFM
jgi:hypothetical protein